MYRTLVLCILNEHVTCERGTFRCFSIFLFYTHNRILGAVMRGKRPLKSSLRSTQTKEVILGPCCASAQQAGTYRLLLLLSCGETEQREKERKKG